jgi:hypothetical protein
MTDRQELKRLAEAAPCGPWISENDSLYFKEDGYTRHLLDADAGHDVEDEAYYAALNFIAVANPATVVALIAENEGLHAQHARDSGELRKLCAARDSARRERDQFKANSERHKMDLECAQLNLSIAVGVKNSQQSELHEAQAENEALRKDAERYRFVSQLAWYIDKAAYVYDIGKATSAWADDREAVDSDDVEAAIDTAMGEGDRP